MRRIIVLSALLAAVVLTAPASAQTESRLAVTATSDRCDSGLPVVDYRVENRWSTPVSAQVWWVADASVYGMAARHDLGPAPDSETGSLTLPYAFYATVTVYVTASWPDGQTTASASWAIPVADCTAPPTTGATTTTVTPTTVDQPTTTTTDGPGNNGNGHGRPTTTVEAG